MAGLRPGPPPRTATQPAAPLMRPSRGRCRALPRQVEVHLSSRAAHPRHTHRTGVKRTQPLGDCRSAGVGRTAGFSAPVTVRKPLGSSVSLLFFAVGISCFRVQGAPVSQFAGQMKSKNKRNCIHTWGRKGSSIHSLSFSHGSLMVSSVQKCFVFRFKFAAKDFYPLGKGLLRVRSFCRV